MLWKSTTVPDGIPGSPGPPHHTLAQRGRTALELARALPHLQHRPTRGQLWLMTQLDGRRPSTYRLDADVNPLPESLPTSFPHGTDGLRFAHADGEVVALPDGCGFSL